MNSSVISPTCKNLRSLGLRLSLNRLFLCSLILILQYIVIFVKGKMPLVRTKSISHPLARDTHAEDEDTRSDQTHLTIGAMVRTSAPPQVNVSLLCSILYNITTRLLWNLTKKKRSKEVESIVNIREALRLKGRTVPL